MRNPRGWVIWGFAVLLALLSAAIPITLKGLAQARILQAVERTGGHVEFAETGGLRVWLAGLVGPEFVFDIAAITIGRLDLSKDPGDDPVAWPKLLASVGEVSRLESLSFRPLEVDRDCLEQIGKIRTLSAVSLNCASGDDLSALSGLKSLQVLDLVLASKITPAALDALSRLPALETLQLCDSDIRGSSLEEFRKFRRLVTLDLRGTRLARHDLLLLADAPKLKTVLVNSTLGTAEEVADVQSKLPHITIEVDPGWP